MVIYVDDVVIIGVVLEFIVGLVVIWVFYEF